MHYTVASKMFHNSIKILLRNWKISFDINSYDKWFTNKIADEKQCTNVWFVNDVKFTHVKQSVVKRVTAEIEKPIQEDEPNVWPKKWILRHGNRVH